MDLRRDPRIVALVLAGGQGTRLRPLTDERTKPAVPFGGKWRIIDFVLSNLVNSGIHRIYVLTQYKAQSLLEHLQDTWVRSFGRDSFITAVPAQMQAGSTWYQGTADAIHQNLRLLDRTRPDLVAVFGGDHIYKMNVGQMVDFHRESGARATVASLPVPKKDASAFGVIRIDDDWRITGFEEKPESPSEIPGRPGWSLVSMGNYIFDTATLNQYLCEDASHSESVHDFGKSILPEMVSSLPVYAYDFQRNLIPLETTGESAYWRDIGTLDAYFEANLDLKNVEPKLNVYNWDWPIRAVSYSDPPVKFVFDEKHRRGEAVQSLVAGGCIISGGHVKDSVLGRNIHVDDGAVIENCIILDNCWIQKGAQLRNVIVDKNNIIEAGEKIGHDLDLDRERFTVSPNGVVAVARAEDSPESRARNL
jgi:glucose-1-phosphate adenylyltransferase